MWKLLQMAVKSKVVRNMVLSFVAGLLLGAIVMVTNLQKTLCSLPLMNKLEFCQEDFRPIKDEKLSEIAVAIMEMRASVVNDNNQIGEKFTYRTTKYEDDEAVNEAEVYLRALINLDMAVLNDSDVTAKNIESGKYKGTNLAKMWGVVRSMQLSADYNDVKEEAAKNDWEEKEWLQYAQLRVYACYLVGNEVDSIDGKFWGAVKGIVGMDHEPCEELERLTGSQYVQGGGAVEVHKFPDGTEKELIDHGDIAVVKQKVTTYEYYEYCYNPNSRASLDTANVVYADTKDRATESTRGDCNAGEEKKSEIKERTELAYLTKMSIVEGFEKYSLYQKTENGPVPDKEMSFKDKLHETVAEIYKEAIGTPISGGMGSIFNGWLIPLEEGTYYIFSPYGPRSGGFHYGSDLSSLGRMGIPIYAPADGIVEFANANDASPVGVDPTNDRESKGCSGRIVIRHTNNWMTAFCHVLRPDVLVHTGWKVKQGQIIAATGNGGNSDPHLHFEMCPPVPSLKECSGAASQVDSENHEGAQLVYNRDRGKLDDELIAKRQKEFKDWKQKIGELANKSEEEVSKLLVSLSPMSMAGGVVPGGKEPFGAVSAYFETGGFNRPEYCNQLPGDDMSCGTWQFTHYKQKDFTNKMKEWGEIELYNILSQGTPGVLSSFKPVWEQAAQLVGKPKFLQLQKRLLAETYFPDAIKFTKEKTGLNLTEQSYAMQEAMLSVSVHHGYTGGSSVLKYAYGGADMSQAGDPAIINKMYVERQNTDRWFQRQIPSIRKSVRNRLIYEQCIINTFLQDPNLAYALVQHGQTTCVDPR